MKRPKRKVRKGLLITEKEDKYMSLMFLRVAGRKKKEMRLEKRGAHRQAGAG